MGSLKDPKTLIPHINPDKDCSQEICTIFCRQWCKYIILPSPPPPSNHGGATLSPVVIVIVTLIGALFLLIGCYFIISRYCSRNYRSSVLLRQWVDDPETRELESGVDGLHRVEDHSDYVPWIVIGKGLDERFIKSISVCKYKKEDGLVTCTDCSVCLGEFQEEESIKLLPKCSHAFHVYCIDTWLKTHLNCPLCRANVCFDVKFSTPVSPPLPAAVMTSESGERDVTFEIGEEPRMKMKRSKSMDCLYQARVSVARVVFFDQTQEATKQEDGIRGTVVRL
ncbi:hypothetical protein SSX86_022016 [Deinandra increscens subsp. villosa]|uniref:RING-type E3 ubiquitin transferase n=1 Tax=Deinandra increscens subsp. villosa TaxID=3103831 RepID=A0AAP0CMC7_9ASTR